MSAHLPQRKIALCLFSLDLFSLKDSDNVTAHFGKGHRAYKRSCALIVMYIIVVTTKLKMHFVHLDIEVYCIFLLKRNLLNDFKKRLTMLSFGGHAKNTFISFLKIQCIIRLFL